MLRKLTLGFTGVMAAAIAIAGCSSNTASTTISQGPNFASQSLYATNTTQNGISIYPAGTKTGSGPQYQISSQNTLNGPQYLAFDSTSDIFSTNYDAGTGAASIVEIKAAATGNVLPLNVYSFTSARARGIADYQTTFGTSTTKVDVIVAGVVDATQPLAFANQLQWFQALLLGGPYQTLAGPNTGLNVPSGVAVDKNGNVYVANSQGGNVEVFVVPSPSPTPSPTATPTPTPSPSPTPSGATASPTPSPVPTATPINIAPMASIQGALTLLGTPTGIGLDSNLNIYVADPASKSTLCGSSPCAAILKFAAGSNLNVAPTTVIAGPATLLYAPTDVKVDSSGQIYVADSNQAGAGVIYIFAATASGNVAPVATFTSPGAVIGLGLSP